MLLATQTKNVKVFIETSVEVISLHSHNIIKHY